MSTTFDDIELDPKFFGWGSTAAASHATSIIATAKGYEQRVPLLGTATRRYQINRRLEIADYYELLTFASVRQGSVRGFKITDHLDFTTASDHVSAHSATDVRIGTGDGSTASFQIVKRYAAGTPFETTRAITKTNDVLVAVNGTTKTVTTHYTLDSSTGIITFTGGSIPALGDGIEVGCSFYVPVHFDEATDQWLALSHDGYQNAGVSPGLIEEKSTVAAQEFVPTGSTADSAFIGSIDRQLEFRHGTYVLFVPTGAHDVYLPDLGQGGGQKYVQHYSGAFGWQFVLDNSGTNTITIYGKDWTSGNWTSLGTITQYQAKTATAVAGSWTLA